MTTKPALLKMDSAMKNAYHRAWKGSMPRVMKRGSRTTVRTDSTMVAVRMTARSREATSPRRDWFSVAAIMRWVRPTCRDTARESRDARVMTPRPPMAAPTIMTSWPKVDQ